MDIYFSGLLINMMQNFQKLGRSCAQRAELKVPIVPVVYIVQYVVAVTVCRSGDDDIAGIYERRNKSGAYETA